MKGMIDKFKSVRFHRRRESYGFINDNPNGGKSRAQHGNTYNPTNLSHFFFPFSTLSTTEHTEYTEKSKFWEGAFREFRVFRGSEIASPDCHGFMSFHQYHPPQTSPVTASM